MPKDILYYAAVDDRVMHRADDADAAYDLFVEKEGLPPDQVMAITDDKDGSLEGYTVWGNDDDEEGDGEEVRETDGDTAPGT